MTLLAHLAFKLQNNLGNCEVWRNAWETIQNEYLERNGRPERVSLKSYERQGIEKIPMVHMGPAVAHMEEKGIRTSIGDLNRDIKAANSLMATIRNALAALQAWCTRRSYINNNSRKENNTGVKSKETKGTCDAFIMVDDQICQVKESTCP